MADGRFRKAPLSACVASLRARGTTLSSFPGSTRSGGVVLEGPKGGHDFAISLHHSLCSVSVQASLG